MNLNGRVAIVTGAKSGIGLATAARFASAGARVIMADVQDASREAGDLVREGGEAIFVQVDVSDASQVAATIAKTVSIFNRLDILVNSAGVELAKKVIDTTEAEWDLLMNVNLKGIFLFSKAAIPVMRATGGVIVNVASELGLVGGSEIAAYAASKGGVVQLTKAIAIDHAADGIRVNCVAPGPVSTPLLEKIIQSASDPEAERQSIISRTVLGRLAAPDEIANVIVFMASDAASYMTGSVVCVDGGWTAQ